MEDQKTKEAKIIEAGSLWEKGGKRRVYFNGILELACDRVSRKQNGSVKAAYFDGEKMSNSDARKVERAKLWYDLDSGEWCHKGLSFNFDILDEAIAAIENKIKG